MGSSREISRKRGRARPAGRVGSDDRARPFGRVFRPVAVVGRACAIDRRLEQRRVDGDERVQVAVEDRYRGVIIAAGMVVMAGGAARIPLSVTAVGLSQRVIGRRAGGDMDVQRTVIDIDDVCVIVMMDRHRRPVRSMRELVPAFLDSVQAQHRHEGGAQADAEGAKQAKQGWLAPASAIVRPARSGNSRLPTMLRSWAKGNAPGRISA